MQQNILPFTVANVQLGALNEVDPRHPGTVISGMARWSRRDRPCGDGARGIGTVGELQRVMKYLPVVSQPRKRRHNDESGEDRGVAARNSPQTRVAAKPVEQGTKSETDAQYPP